MPPTPPDPLQACALASPVVLALLAAAGCHVLLLDSELRLLGHDPGAPEALGLKTGPGGFDVLPVLARTQFASRGFRLCGPPRPLGGQGHHLWIYRDVRSFERREELEMVFLHQLLSALVSSGPAGQGEASTHRLQRMWDTAMALYRELVAPRLRQDPGGPREAPGCRILEEGVPVLEPALPVPEPPGRSGPKVLVVDDAPMVRRLLQAVLAKDYQVLCAADGGEALALAQEHQPDLVLLDAVMPVLDGFTVCQRLKADPRTREIPVLFLTALQGELDEVRALEAGAIDFIQKPINGPTVLARVRNHIELKHSREDLMRLAACDGLTALANRRHFDQMLAVEWQRSRREGHPLSLILGDVDSFKAFNDTYGHLEGDACLKAVAGVFRDALRRPADLAARYGGEEFVCLLPETDQAGAKALVDLITDAMAALAMPHAGSEVAPQVTMSLGVATAYPTLHEGPELLVEEADRRMYEAKRKAKARNLKTGA